jgi:hypothetical protein
VADYRDIIRANWDDRVPAHRASAGYQVRRFIAEPDFISHVVRFDRPRLGDVSGLRGVHLQCHIGTDTPHRGGHDLARPVGVTDVETDATFAHTVTNW